MRSDIQRHLELPRNDARHFAGVARTLLREAELKGEKLHLYNLGVGEPDFRTPAHIREAAASCIQTEPVLYGPPTGWPWLRDLIAQKVARVNGYTVDAEHVTISMGATGAIMAIQTALLDPGDEVLVPSPGWPQYRMQLACNGGVPVLYPLQAHTWLPDMEALERLVTPRTRMLIINSPSNPTGAVFPASVVQDLLTFARRHDLYLLSDECYDELVFTGQFVGPASLLSAEELEASKIISVYSFSKTYSMTGWRIGYIVASKELLRPIVHVLDSTHTNVSTVVQRAAAAALTGSQECVREMRESYRRRRDLVLEHLKQYGLDVPAPDGAFYVMVPIGGNDNSEVNSTQFTYDLLTNHHVVVAPGDSYGSNSKNFVRISLASSESDLVVGVREICLLQRQLV